MRKAPQKMRTTEEIMDTAQIDESGKGCLFFGNAPVLNLTAVPGQHSVFLLETEIVLDRPGQLAPKPGQFYELRSAKSAVTFGRPISVYHAAVESQADGRRAVRLRFLILKKGNGTGELCSMQPGENLVLLGPLGNTWLRPNGTKNAAIQLEPFGTQGKPEVCIVGGGIGVAPVAYLASSLAPQSYDFFASFKTGSYGLDNVQARELVVTTDDGSVGIHGMLPEALTEQKIRDAGYKVIFACGPSPMLAYVQNVADRCGVACYLSLEHRMLCGMGACLGCTIFTKDGNRRVCKDGPVFDAALITFPKPDAPHNVQPEPASPKEPNLGVDIAGLHFQNPVFAASGTFGYGQNYRGVFDVEQLGAICSKGITLEPRAGNPGERIVEVPAGNINSIGLENPGVPHFIAHELPQMLALQKTVAIVNLAGGDLDSYVQGAALLEKTAAPMIELNISCPNVKAGGMAWGILPDAAKTCVAAVRSATTKPLMVKLSPNAPDIRAVAMACVEAGADALSLINTVQAMAIDIEKAKPFFENVRAGWCGPAIKPLALRLVYDVVEEMNRLPPQKRIPVVGLGGICTWQDAVEFIMAGASAIEVGTATFFNPTAMLSIIKGLATFMRTHGYATIQDLCGIAQTA